MLKLHSEGFLPIIASPATARGLATPTVPRTVLLAEDNDDLREVMGLFLAISGFAVVPCHDGQLALQAFKADPSNYDLLLTDVQMPGMTGIELARELTSRRPALPVIIVSASWISPEVAGEFNRCGWVFLQKPVGLVSVLKTIERLLPDIAKTPSSTLEASKPVGDRTARKASVC